MDEALKQTERWFVSRGIPHFIDEYSASRDVFTRAAPFLSLVFVVEVVGALNLDWPVWANVLAGLGGLCILVAALATSNRLRRRPALARPETVGLPDLSLFVLVPGLLPLVFGGQARQAGSVAGGNLVLVALAYMVTGYGLLPMTRWGIGRLVRQTEELFGVLVRALPLLLLFVTFLFVNAEVWQVASGLTGPFFFLALGLFFVMGTLFVLTRLPREIAGLGAFQSDAAVLDRVRGTPAEALPRPASILPAPALARRERGNVGLVVLFSQGLQILLVTLVIGAFFVTFGVVAIPPDVIASWTGAGAHTLASVTLFDRVLPVTEELVRVAGFLAAFSGLYFTVYAVTDVTYREEFYEDVVREVREALAVRALYLAALRERLVPKPLSRASAASGSSPPSPGE